MSGELLLKRPYFGPPGADDDSEDAKPQHAAIHDLESLWWVLVWLCIRCSGPCTRRAELQCKELPGTQRLHQDWLSLFEEPALTIGANKRSVMRADDELGSMVLKHFTPFCKPLKKLVKAFWQVLNDAYKSYDFTGLHHKVLGCLKDAEEQLPPQASPYDHATSAKEIDRWEEIRLLQDRRRREGLDAQWHQDTPSKVKEKATNPDDNDDGDLQSSPTRHAAKRLRTSSRGAVSNDLVLGNSGVPVAGPSTNTSNTGSRGTSTARRTSRRRKDAAGVLDILYSALSYITLLDEDGSCTTNTNPAQDPSRGRANRSQSTSRNRSAGGRSTRSSKFFTYSLKNRSHLKFFSPRSFPRSLGQALDVL